MEEDDKKEDFLYVNTEKYKQNNYNKNKLYSSLINRNSLFNYKFPMIKIGNKINTTTTTTTTTMFVNNNNNNNNSSSSNSSNKSISKINSVNDMIDESNNDKKPGNSRIYYHPLTCQPIDNENTDIIDSNNVKDSCNISAYLSNTSIDEFSDVKAYLFTIFIITNIFLTL
jgi:hypothetical protein